MQRRRWRLRTVAAALVSGVVLVVTLVGPASAYTSDAALFGSWSDPVPLGIVGVHAALLPTGKVLYYDVPNTTTLGHARVFDPLTDQSVVADPHLDWSVFCSGMSIMADGRVFATGGEAPRSDNPPGTGVENAVFFDPVGQAWSAAPSMEYARWYPSNVNMPDGSVIVMGGDRVPRDLYADAAVPQMERFEPTTNQWTTLPTSADIVGRYLRGMLLPNGHILVAGPGAMSREFDPVTNEWTDVSAMSFGDREAGGVVLLPGLQRVLTSGGYAPDDEIATPTAEVLDLTSANPQWTSTGPMATARANHNLVLLPDGTVLAVGGGQQGAWGSPVESAELYDPSSGTWRTMASQTAPRSYHSTALLLPDGRVISAGSNSGSPYQTTVEFYSPPYLFQGPRPSISSAPRDIAYGGGFDVQTPDADAISRVALISLGVDTHGWADDQRYVDLDFTRDDGVLHMTAPSDAAQAPAGPYMLFILDGNGVPSVASIMSLSSSVPTFTLNVTTDGTGTGSVTSDVGGIDCPGSCSASGLAHYGHVILTATPDAGATFAGWSDPGCPGTSACDVTMGSDRTVTARFDLPSLTSTLKDNDAAVAFNGWFGVVDASASGGSYRVSNVKNDSVEWKSPSTTSLTWITRTGPARGKASVTIDGKSKGTFDLYAPAPASTGKVFSGFARRAHSVVIKVLHAKNVASTNFGVPVDAFVVGATTFEESSTAVTYNTWKSAAQAHATDGTYRSATSSKATVAVTFTGTSIDWRTAAGKAYGKASVTIDGVNEGTFDLYRVATAWQSVISFTGLSAGPHVMVIQVLGQRNAASQSTRVIVDGFVVHA